MKRRTAFGLSLAVAAAMTLSVSALADDSVLEDGTYTLTVPGVGDVTFDVLTDGDDTTVTATATPSDVEPDDSSDSKETFEDLGVELKPSKVEVDIAWANGDAVTLALPGGTDTITVSYDGSDWTVEAGGWTVEGEGEKWFLWTPEGDRADADQVFKVEVDEDGVVIKAADADEDADSEDTASEDDGSDDDSDDDDSSDDESTDDDKSAEKADKANKGKGGDDGSDD